MSKFFWWLIVSHLELRDILMASQTCKLWNEKLSSNFVWKRVFMREWNVFADAYINKRKQRGDLLKEGVFKEGFLRGFPFEHRRTALLSTIEIPPALLNLASHPQDGKKWQSSLQRYLDHPLGRMVQLLNPPKKGLSYEKRVDICLEMLQDMPIYEEELRGCYFNYANNWHMALQCVLEVMMKEKLSVEKLEEALTAIERKLVKNPDFLLMREYEGMIEFLKLKNLKKYGARLLRTMRNEEMGERMTCEAFLFRDLLILPKWEYEMGEKNVEERPIFVYRGHNSTYPEFVQPLFMFTEPWSFKPLREISKKMTEKGVALVLLCLTLKKDSSFKLSEDDLIDYKLYENIAALSIKHPHALSIPPSSSARFRFFFGMYLRKFNPTLLDTI